MVIHSAILVISLSRVNLGRHSSSLDMPSLTINLPRAFFYRDFIRIKGSHPTLSYSSLGIGCQNELFFLCGSACFEYCSSFFKQAVIACIIVDVLGVDKTLPYYGMGIHSRTGVCIRRTAVESLERLHVRSLCLLK